MQLVDFDDRGPPVKFKTADDLVQGNDGLYLSPEPLILQCRLEIFGSSLL